MLSQRATLTIGLLTPQALSVIFSNPFFGAFSEGVAFAAEESGYALYFISPLHGSLAGAMGRATVDGVVAIGLSDDHPDVEQIRRAGVPIVVVDSSPLHGHGSIEVDDLGGARAAAEHLIALGHRDVLVIGIEPPTPARTIDDDGVVARRLRGYRAAFATVGVDIPDDRIVVGPASIVGGMTALDGAWRDGMHPTAVLAMSDAMAIGAMRALRDLGLDVPGDVSVVGFDDIDLAQHVNPPLTTVHQPIRRKGEEAVRVLLSVVQRRDQARPEHRRLETRLIVRGSTGPVPRHRQEEVDEA
jgi:DNA-binding LacI/PurR family transcriptional regulator